MYKVFNTEEYQEWLDSLSLKEKAQVHSRIAKVMIEGHFGKAKKLDTNLAELKWKNGRRIYFTLTNDDRGKNIILLIGGNKNSQVRDIKKAKSIINRLQ
jgi:putative addiction module killer protein